MPLLTKIVDAYTGIKDYLVAGFVGVSLILGVVCYVEHLQVVAEKAGHKADAATYATSLATFKAQAIQNKMKVEKEHNDETDKANASYVSLLAKYDRAVGVYTSTKSGGGQELYLPGSPQAASSTDGPDRDTFVPSGGTVEVPIDDLEVCAVNTAKLVSSQPWALELLKENEAEEAKLPDDSSKK